MFDSAHSLSRKKTYRVAIALYLVLAIGAGLGLLGKAQLVTHILPLPSRVVYPIVILWVLLPLAWPIALRARRLIAPLVCLGIVCASIFIYPRMENLQKSGRGSDQPDCVIVAAKGIGSGEWPYDRAKLWDHTPMSCGPGWVMMQTPAILAAGYKWNLLLLWLAAILLLRTSLSMDSITGLLTLMGLSAVTWVTASDGTDFLPFGILLAALFVAVQRPSRLAPLFLVLTTLVVQFRFPMFILPILFFPRRKLVQGVAVSIAAFCFQIFFLAWRPETFIADGPLHLFYKLTHTHLLGLTRSSAIFEVSLVCAVMIGAAILVRKYIASPWIGFAYLLAVTVVPAILDLEQKRRAFGSLLPGLGIWEGANWLSGCLPLAALWLLSTRGGTELAGTMESVKVPDTLPMHA